MPNLLPMAQPVRLKRDFFDRDVLEVAPGLLAKTLVISRNEGVCEKYIISETEAYRGTEDLACHASKGRTKRTEVMYQEGGKLYVYFVYGMYWMLNIVTGAVNEPQAVLIRGLKECPGPGRLTKLLGIDRTFYGEDLVTSGRIWVEDSPVIASFRTGPRIGIDYAGDKWINKQWRFSLL